MPRDTEPFPLLRTGQHAYRIALSVGLAFTLSTGDAQAVKNSVQNWNITFATGEHAIPEEGRSTLAAICAAIQDRDNYSIALAGNTDSVGSYAANLELSMKRAEAVRAALITCGAEDTRIMLKGRSFSKPRATNGTEAGREQNRRTGITLTLLYFPVSALEPVEGLAPGATFNLRILFHFDRADFKPGATDRLDEIAAILGRYPDLTFELLGWTAVSQTADDLSGRRAKAVYDYLLTRGIAPKRMTHKGMGGAKCKDPDQYAECRRVEIAIKRNPYYSPPAALQSPEVPVTTAPRPNVK